MNQIITISQTLIHYLAENLPAFEINNAQKIVILLKENKIAVDSKKNFYKTLWLEVSKIQNEIVRHYVFDLIKYWFEQNCYKINTNFISEEKLASVSNDKIYLNPEINSDLKSILLGSHSIESHNDISFIIKFFLSLLFDV